MMTLSDLKKRPAGGLKLVGGRLCLDFVNTVGGRIAPGIRDDKLNDYEDLLAWSLHAGLLTEKETARLLGEAERRPRKAGAVFQRAIRLRESIYRLALALSSRQKSAEADLKLLNRELNEARRHRALTTGRENFSWQWIEPERALDRVLWPIAESAAELFTTGDLRRLRQCGGEGCSWLFEDVSRNGRRQWCVMEVCGNLAKVRRFRRRKRENRQD